MKGIAIIYREYKKLYDCNGCYPTEKTRGQKLNTKNPFNKNIKKRYPHKRKCIYDLKLITRFRYKCI